VGRIEGVLSRPVLFVIKLKTTKQKMGRGYTERLVDK